MENLDFNELKLEVIKTFNKLNTIVLATSHNNRVTARSMSIVNDGLTIYCQTDNSFIKYKQIKKNPNVALCIKNIQIEANAKIVGHPLSNENKKFLELFKIKHEGSYKMYSHLDSEVVIKIEPKLVTLWKYIDGKPCRDYLYIKENKALREFYKT